MDAERAHCFATLRLSSSTNNPTVGRIPQSTGVIDELDFGQRSLVLRQLQPQSRTSSSSPAASSSEQRIRGRGSSSFSHLSPKSGHLSLGSADETARGRLASVATAFVVFYAVVSQDGAGEGYHPWSTWIGSPISLAHRSTAGWIPRWTAASLAAASSVRGERLNRRPARPSSAARRTAR